MIFDTEVTPAKSPPSSPPGERPHLPPPGRAHARVRSLPSPAPEHGGLRALTAADPCVYAQPHRRLDSWFAHPLLERPSHRFFFCSFASGRTNFPSCSNSLRI